MAPVLQEDEEVRALMEQIQQLTAAATPEHPPVSTLRHLVCNRHFRGPYTPCVATRFRGLASAGAGTMCHSLGFKGFVNSEPHRTAPHALCLTSSCSKTASLSRRAATGVTHQRLTRNYRNCLMFPGCKLHQKPFQRPWRWQMPCPSARHVGVAPALRVFRYRNSRQRYNPEAL